MSLLRTLKPAWWFSAHLHVRFEAIYRHGHSSGSIGEGWAEPIQADNPDEIFVDLEEEPSSASPRSSKPDEDGIKPPTSTETAIQYPKSSAFLRPSDLVETHFLALDKCLPRREFLEVRPHFI